MKFWNCKMHITNVYPQKFTNGQEYNGEKKLILQKQIKSNLYFGNL